MKRRTLLGKEKGKPFVARDGALIYELFRHSGIKIRNISLATGWLKSRQRALPHFHKRSEEIYFVLSGHGTVRVGQERLKISVGQAVYVPPKAVHALRNTSKTKPLKVLAISSPPYSDDDMFFID